MARDEEIGRRAWVLDAPAHLWHAGDVVSHNQADMPIIRSHCGRNLTGFMLCLIWASSFDYAHFEERGLVCATCAQGESK